MSKETERLNESLKIDSDHLERLIESMIFHENKQLAYNFCLLATTLLVLHSKSPSLSSSSSSQSSSLDDDGTSTSNSRKKKIELINHLFELTKDGLFAIILYCDQAIEDLIKTVDCIDDFDSKLSHYLKYLKVDLKLRLNHN